MRIAYVIASLKIGGAEVALAQLAPKIKEKGHDVFVAFFHDGPIRARLEAAGIRCTQIQGLITHYDPYGWWRLYRWLQIHNVDIVHTSLWSANIIGRLIGYWIHVPVISDLHGNCTAEGRIRNWGDRLTAGFTSVTIAVSNSVAQAYQYHIIKDRPIKLVTIPNAIDTKRFLLPQEIPLSRIALNIPENAFVVGAVGRLEPIKGYDLLIKACALLPPSTYLLLVGDGSCRHNLEQLAQDMGIADRVVITGLRSDAHRFYQLFDCFAITSHSEGLSLALLEAMASGCPIITTNQTATHDVIENDLTGLIITNRSPEDYAALLTSLMQSPTYRSRLGKAGQEVACRKHDVTNAINMVNALYNELKNSA